MGINIVDRDKLDAALIATASAIRSKTGSSASIAFDMATDMGFKSAIDAIPTGGRDNVADSIIDRTISGAYTNANVSKIGLYAFYNCGSLTEVNFPACTSIDGSAFYNCSSLTEVNFPACTSILSAAFSYCTSLTTVSIPACTTIGSGAFHNCASLTTASFPVCSYIGTSAFRYCDHLLSFYLLGSSVPRLANVQAFSSTPISNYTASTGGVYGSIIVQASMLDAFKKATNWSVYSSRFSAWNGID